MTRRGERVAEMTDDSSAARLGNTYGRWALAVRTLPAHYRPGAATIRGTGTSGNRASPCSRLWKTQEAPRKTA